MENLRISQNVINNVINPAIEEVSNNIDRLRKHSYYIKKTPITLFFKDEFKKINIPLPNEKNMLNTEKVFDEMNVRNSLRVDKFNYREILNNLEMKLLNLQLRKDELLKTELTVNEISLDIPEVVTFKEESVEKLAKPARIKLKEEHIEKTKEERAILGSHEIYNFITVTGTKKVYEKHVGLIDVVEYDFTEFDKLRNQKKELRSNYVDLRFVERPKDGKKGKR